MNFTEVDEDYNEFLWRVMRAFPNNDIEYQLIKLQEELGEAAAAWIGVTGGNPRKGVTHTEKDVADELADVAMTALLAIAKLGFEPSERMRRQRLKVELNFKTELKAVTDAPA